MAREAKRTEIDAQGWRYTGHPEEGKDARALCTIKQDEMVYVGICAWNHTGGYWMQNGVPVRVSVKAWQPLPPPSQGFFAGGKFYLPDEDDR